MTKKTMAAILAMAALIGACAGPDADDSVAVESTASALGLGEPLRLQAGSKLVVYGVTDDDFVLYQDGATLYASALTPNAPRLTVARVGDIQPIVLISGRVALIWTRLFYFGPGGVSPLVVWTARSGPKLASTASIASFTATQGVAVRPDSNEVVFITNASADGTVGDIVSATPDLRSVRTLVSGVSIDFRGSCPPVVGFDTRPRPRDDGDDRLENLIRGRHAHPVIAYCPAGATTATLSRWVGGNKTDLAMGLRAPAQWSSDNGGDNYFTVLADGRKPVLVSAKGQITLLEDGPGRGGFFNYDGSVLAGIPTGNGAELRRYTGSPPEPSVVASFGTGFLFTSRHAGGFAHYTDSPLSRDARLLMYANTVDGSTGLANIFLVDVTQPSPVPVQLEADLRAAASFELFTRNSSHALYYTFDLNTGGNTLMAGSLSGGARKISSGARTEFAHFALTGSQVAYSDNLNGTGTDMFDKHDIMLADVGAKQITPVALAKGAYNLFFPTPNHRAIVYTSDANAASTGLFVARTR
ncbi:hypothetical protein ACLESO_06905 [Pyxidicoccus sp. 3LG]